MSVAKRRYERRGNVSRGVKYDSSSREELPQFGHKLSDCWLKVYSGGRAVVTMHVLPISFVLGIAGVGTPARYGLPLTALRSIDMALRKLAPATDADVVLFHPVGVTVRYPNIWEHLTMTRYPDGEKRETSSIVIVAGEGGWRGCLSDRDNNRVCWKQGRSPEEVLEALEVAAASDDPREWRQSANSQAKKRK